MPAPNSTKQKPSCNNPNFWICPTSEAWKQTVKQNETMILCKIYQKYHIKLKTQDTCCFLWRMAGIPKDSLPSSSSRQWWWRISSSIALTCSLRWKKFIIRYSIRGLGSSMLIIWIIGSQGIIFSHYNFHFKPWFYMPCY